jgi:hypothetical protein
LLLLPAAASPTAGAPHCSDPPGRGQDALGLCVCLCTLLRPRFPGRTALGRGFCFGAGFGLQMAPFLVLGMGGGEQRQERPDQIPKEFPDPRGGRVFAERFEKLLEGFGNAHVFGFERCGSL